MFTLLCALNTTLALFGDRTKWVGASTPAPSSRVLPAGHRVPGLLLPECGDL